MKDRFHTKAIHLSSLLWSCSHLVSTACDKFKTNSLQMNSTKIGIRALKIANLCLSQVTLSKN